MITPFIAAESKVLQGHLGGGGFKLGEEPEPMLGDDPTTLSSDVMSAITGTSSAIDRICYRRAE